MRGTEHIEQMEAEFRMTHGNASPILHRTGPPGCCYHPCHAWTKPARAQSHNNLTNLWKPSVYQHCSFLPSLFPVYNGRCRYLARWMRLVPSLTRHGPIASPLVVQTCKTKKIHPSRIYIYSSFSTYKQCFFTVLHGESRDLLPRRMLLDHT